MATRYPLYNKHIRCCWYHQQNNSDADLQYLDFDVLFCVFTEKLKSMWYVVETKLFNFFSN